jgi:hypothetical protein
MPVPSGKITTTKIMQGLDKVKEVTQVEVEENELSDKEG